MNEKITQGIRLSKRARVQKKSLTLMIAKRVVIHLLILIWYTNSYKPHLIKELLHENEEATRNNHHNLIIVVD